MKTFKLVAGIICIILSVLIMFQSCAVGVGNTICKTNETSGSAGFITALMFLSGGITMIATRNSEKKGGIIANIILFSNSTFPIFKFFIYFFSIFIIIPSLRHKLDWKRIKF